MRQTRRTALSRPRDKDVRERLLAWFDREKREMPWRGTDDPYRVWISEIMLQQTQVATVVPYYERFLERFPDVESLADAPEDEVLRLWAGLGYYSRARNLLKAAKIIRERGAFPDSFKELLSLPGFGRYSAGAVASIAFGRREACVDGNVVRVVARLLAIRENPREAPTRRLIEETAAQWVPADRPGDFNQAMMELGAVVCRRQEPACLLCPLASLCAARREGIEADIPPRRSMKAEKVTAAIGVLRERGRVLISRRPEGGRFAGMWEFPGGKVKRDETPAEALAREFREEVGLRIEVGEKLDLIHHAYTRFRVALHVFEVRRVGNEKARPLQVDEVLWARLSELDRYAFPAANRRIVETLFPGKNKTPSRRDK